MMSMKDTSDKSALKDALLNTAATLQDMYAEFAQEEGQLAEAGLEHYARTLEREEALS
jgi:flavin-binding protein dodecin